MIPNDDALDEAAARLELIARARAFHDMLLTEGWKILYSYRVAIVEKARTDLRKVQTGDTAATVDAVQRWQIAEGLLEAEAEFINNTLSHAQEIQGNVTLDDALLMEAVREHQPAEHRPDPAGY